MSTQAGATAGDGTGRRGRTAARTRRIAALLTAAAAVGTLTALPARADGTAALPPYAFDPGAQRIQGAASSADARVLEPGRTYRDTLKKDGKVYYRLDLDVKRNAYVSAVAVPKPGGKAAYGDGFRIAIQDGSGTECGYQEVNFASGDHVRPLTGYARRIVDPDASGCQDAGTYYVLVERESDAASAADDWELELQHVSEPLLSKAGPDELPDSWPSGTPAPPTGGPTVRQGGDGFHAAVSLRSGEWRADILPGQTLFWRVPVDWGQQLFATAELGSSSTGDELVGNALALGLDNPARGYVDLQTVGYSGKQATAALAPQRPVAHENRSSYETATSGMRFAGWYYLTATLSPEIAREYGDKAVPLTLRVTVRGDRKPGPGYDGDPGVFQVTADDDKAAENGLTGGGDGTDGTMVALAAGGLGLGTVLLAGLGAWTLLARRRTPAGH
ncbi:hypothetical protein [Streptomyces omiyaensis]|uniref:hypothetical protein n=1 Tax=Streptomyces omiyaensis TaxID=68247 RepID=UPI0019B6AD55|nr:hypothetical protein [Streptomyces omiyaensis]GGY66864.1 hypothetical protein GCM10010363_55160 [Streptomyces omiyaensis]